MKRLLIALLLASGSGQAAQYKPLILSASGQYQTIHTGDFLTLPGLVSSDYLCTDSSTNMISCAAISSGYVVGNNTSGSAYAAPASVTSIFDRAFSTTQGSLIYRGSSTWSALAPSSTAGYVLTTQGAGADPQWALAGNTNQNTRSITYIVNAGALGVTAGVYVGPKVPFNCTLTDVTLLADQVGNVTVDVWKAPYTAYPPTLSNSITGSNFPTLSGTLKYDDNSLSGWTTAVSAGDNFYYKLSTVATIQQLTISMTCVVTS